MRVQTQSNIMRTRTSCLCPVDENGQFRLSLEPRLKGQVCIITGASRGIGQAIAVRFAQEGARVVLLDVLSCEETLEAVAGVAGIGTEGLPSVAKALHCDVTSEASIQEALRIAGDWAGGLAHVLVNSACRFVFESVETAAPADWDISFAINVRGAALVTKAAVPLMRAAGGGSVVFMGSISSFMAQPNCATYACTKGAVVQLARNCAFDLAADGIRCNSVCPGSIETPIQEEERRAHGWTPEQQAEIKTRDVMLRRLGLPLEVANLALFLASDESSYCTGGSFMVDGGSSACTIMSDS